MNPGVFLVWFGINCSFCFLIPLFVFQERPSPFYDADLPFFLQPSRPVRRGESRHPVLFMTSRE